MGEVDNDNFTIGSPGTTCVWTNKFTNQGCIIFNDNAGFSYDKGYIYVLGKPTISQYYNVVSSPVILKVIGLQQTNIFGTIILKDKVFLNKKTPKNSPPQIFVK